MTGVLDANAVIGLVKGRVFPLLAQLYTGLFIPPAVVREIIGPGQRAGAAELQAALGDWITEVTPDPQAVQSFASALRSEADREVLALAQIQAVDHVLSSDFRMIQVGSRAGLTCLQAPEVVLLMKRRGLIPAVQPVLNQMRGQGFGIGDRIYQQTLQAAGE
ncbi:MAG TPA: DUF3368 domain-containing protein [Armatimonadota bacterium]|nr:DUF3368 domain-containing protein [Armatimonadota bacterium]